MSKIVKIGLIVFCLLLVADLGYINIQIITGISGSKVGFIGFKSTESTKSTENTDIKNKEGCGLACQRVIEEKVASEVAKLADEWEKELVVPTQRVITQKITTSVNEPKIVVIPITSYGESGLVSWTEVKPSEFYFDLINYTGAKEVRFEAYLAADQGAAKVYARLYDATNNRGVDYSDIQTNSSSYIRIQSSKVSIWRGNNKYIVQIKSDNGTVAKIKDAKIVIIY